MIPTTGNWTVIFSRESGAWGSFSYDQKEDAARISVAKPEAVEFPGTPRILLRRADA